MARERRNDRGRYDTRSRKACGRVLREYVGAGIPGELVAAADQGARRREQEEAARIKNALGALAEQSSERMTEELAEWGGRRMRRLPLEA